MNKLIIVLSITITYLGFSENKEHRKADGASSESSAYEGSTATPTEIQDIQGKLIHGAVTKIGQCGESKKKLQEGDITWNLKQPLYSALSQYIKVLEQKPKDKPFPYTKEEFQNHLAKAFNDGKAFKDINDDKAKNYISTIASFYSQAFDLVFEKFKKEPPAKKQSTKKFSNSDKQLLNDYNLLNELDKLKENNKSLLSSIQNHERDLQEWLISGECKKRKNTPADLTQTVVQSDKEKELAESIGKEQSEKLSSEAQANGGAKKEDNPYSEHVKDYEEDKQYKEAIGQEPNGELSPEAQANGGADVYNTGDID